MRYDADRPRAVIRLMRISQPRTTSLAGAIRLRDLQAKNEPVSGPVGAVRERVVARHRHDARQPRVRVAVTWPSRNVSANGSATCVKRWRAPSQPINGRFTPNKRLISARFAADWRLVAALARRDPNRLLVFHRNGIAIRRWRTACRLSGGRRADPLPPRLPPHRRPQPASPRRQAPRHVASILDSARELGIRDAQGRRSPAVDGGCLRARERPPW